MNIFQKINKSSRNKIETKLATSLKRRFNPIISYDLSNLIELAYFQYVVGNTETSFELASLISDIKFANDFDIWTWVEYGLVLLSAIYKERSEENFANECTNKITARLNEDSPVNRKVFKRTLNGDRISKAYKKIEQAHDEKSEYAERVALLMNLMLIREMGGGEAFTCEMADKEIQENIERIQVLVETFNNMPQTNESVRAYTINPDKVEDVFSENLGEGYRIVLDNGELSPIIEWVDWVQQSENDNDIRVEVNFEDGWMEVYEKGVKLQQIWYEDVV